MTTRKRQWTAAVCSGTLFLACGQSDPPDTMTMPSGGSGSMAPSDGGEAGDDGEGGQGGAEVPTDTASYFPIVDGTVYKYAHTSGWVETVEISAVTHNGMSASLFSDAGDPAGERSESTMVRVGSAVYRVEKKSFDGAGAELPRVEYDPGFIRADDAWANEPVGTKITIGYQRTEFALDGTTSVLDREHIYTIESVSETTTTAAGTFMNCLRIRRKRGWVTNIPGAEAQEKLFWLCPGVGKVREETPTTGKSELLLEYDIP